ncbi:hypothetical protein [Enterovibrio norvegicus]|uniref:Uncharacterized protein n=1 Tax=Enterovibrio norvegicus TaxID=188144 RepID=A0ABV4L6Y8_9GAMM|nr:hypothetical protein [Enterovibrio norvegicus]OEF56087.1 hypothetical protein A1OU_15045 [Enterovibrio norvegicus]
MIFLNNARNYNHEEIHSIKGAIYDRKVDASDYGYRALLKVNKGDNAVVCSPTGNGFIKIAEYQITENIPSRKGYGYECQVLTGLLLRSTELPKTEAAQNLLGKRFFDKNGNFLRRAVLT